MTHFIRSARGSAASKINAPVKMEEDADTFTTTRAIKNIRPTNSPSTKTRGTIIMKPRVTRRETHASEHQAPRLYQAGAHKIIMKSSTEEIETPAPPTTKKNKNIDIRPGENQEVWAKLAKTNRRRGRHLVYLKTRRRDNGRCTRSKGANGEGSKILIRR